MKNSYQDKFSSHYQRKRPSKFLTKDEERKLSLAISKGTHRRIFETAEQIEWVKDNSSLRISGQTEDLANRLVEYASKMRQRRIVERYTLTDEKGFLLYQKVCPGCSIEIEESGRSVNNKKGFDVKLSQDAKDRGRVIALIYRTPDALSARNTLILSNFGIVINLAKRQRGIPIEDSIQDGLLGLMRAADLYKPSIGRFSTYATIGARSAIQKGTCIFYGHPVHVEVILTRLGKISTELTNKLGRPPEKQEVLKRVLADKKEKRLSRKNFEVYWIEFQRKTSALSRTEREFDSEIVSTENYSGELEETDFLEKALPTLSQEERRIIYSRFGLWGKTPLTLQELGDEMGCSRERIRQIQEEALNKMRTLVE